MNEMRFNTSNLDLVEYAVKVLGFLEVQQNQYPFINLNFCLDVSIAPEYDTVTEVFHVDDFGNDIGFSLKIPTKLYSEEQKRDMRHKIFRYIMENCVTHLVGSDAKSDEILSNVESSRTFKIAIEKLLKIAEDEIVKEFSND